MSNFYCAAPWRGLHINPRGNVKTCCAGNPNMLGNLNEHTIVEILNGDKLKEIRASIQAGVAHEYCGNCVNRERNNGDSERRWHNSINKDFDYITAGSEYHYPALIDVRWNTTCNQSCNYCNAKQSSKWANLLGQHIDINTRHYYEDVCEFIAQHYDQVKEVALVGGEPFLLKENARLLDVIPPDAVVTVITNLSADLEHSEIFQKLKTRRKVGWSISFDNIESRFEYVRYGADWNRILHNLDLVQELIQNNGHWGGIHAVYNLYNATRLVEFKKFAQSRGLSIVWQDLNWPVELDIRTYGSEIASLATQEIDRLFAACEVNEVERSLFEHARSQYQTATSPSTEQLTKLKKFVERMEQYHPDKQGEFARLWPEFGDLL